MPPEHRAPHRNPRVGGFRPREVDVVAQVPADVARGETQGAQARDHQVREILAHAVARLKYLMDGRRDSGGALVVLKLFKDIWRNR